MINNNTPGNGHDILEQLRQSRHAQQKRRMTHNLFLRNILNSIFIIVALVAMIGILVDNTRAMLWYSVGLFAVIIKMVEVVLRMPGIKKNNFSARNS